MKICVLIKQVPDTDSVIKISNDQKSIEMEGITLATNESDSYALEEALLLKEDQGGEVTVLSLGGESCQQVLKDALAKGADKAIHLDDDDYKDLDILSAAKVMVNVLKDKEFDIIFSGLQSDDIGNAQLGLIMAELLDTSHASLVMGTEILDEKTIKVKQELEGGWFQWSELDLPASITIQSGLNKPRYASLRGIMMMKRKPLESIKVSELNLENTSSKSFVHKLYIPQKTKETVFIQGSADQVVDGLIEKLTNEIKVL
ncbi:MAG: electron transfer flavoprotein subunit beta/FixA family protein [Candidatus Marinimicrobia bacterium]|jgi:electron transfer flavoprotein beta subunit|nr:electron transfer flavoprotein subunit beta/FixA family protein [Candidatus Neomarinimicrobiota bacterium]MBT3633887.1 electron transfer flavoprotein subunit beta/FixA family protein [Candidatus Neomarinimicrobiota bacterium]MBT3682863.1 electron transfer flavoprotein subunit beta/FixA family protein [Candidatus Neomarinimicrobiota bacterium]MBT3759950.1 electron transfer flavoprotein subunit beta/FixA family protein [Candidatus Neomarinimicrobiota bacterium]MBT3896044.1 electron transfer fl